MLHRLTSFWRKNYTLASPSADLLALFGALPTAGGISVTPESAMRVPAVNCGVRTIAETLAQLPVKVYRRGADGAKEAATEHPAYALLHDAPNEWTSAYEFKHQLAVDLLFEGNAYALVIRVRGAIEELVRLSSRQVRIETDGLAPAYYLREESGERRLGRDEILHVRINSRDGVRGCSPLVDCREAIAILALMERHAATLFGQGGRPSGILQLAQKISPEAAKRIAASWSAQHAGENAGRTAVLEQGAEFKALTFSSVDLQFLELRKQAVEEVARILRVPPHLLFEMGRATWGNAEEMGRSFLDYCLLPYVKNIEGALRRSLFTAEERGTYFAEFLVDDLLRADIAKRSDAYQKMIAARVLNPNEARAMENRPPYPGGDEFVNPNVTPAAAPAANGGQP